jgi:hypothetical protein
MSYILILRLIHIVCAVFWAGGTLYLAGFVIPAVKSLGPDGAKFMQQLSKTNKLPLIMSLAGTLTVVAGILLIWELSNGESAWFGTNYGMTLTIAGTLAILAYLVGITMNLPTINRMNSLGQTIAASGGPPSAEQQSQLMALRKKLFMATNIIAVLLFCAVIGMSIARYI